MERKIIDKLGMKAILVAFVVCGFSQIGFGASAESLDRIDLKHLRSVTCYSQPPNHGRSTLRAFRAEDGVFQTIFFFSMAADQKPRFTEIPITGKALGYQEMSFSLFGKGDSDSREFVAQVTITNEKLNAHGNGNFIEIEVPSKFSINGAHYALRCTVSLM